MPSDIIKVTFLDIGVGDSTAVTFTEDGVRRCILVDGGEERGAPSVIAEHLNREKVEAIDLLVLTHFDQDHILGLINLLKGIADGKGPMGGLKLRNYWGPMPKSTTAQISPTHTGLSPLSRFVIESVEQNESLLKQVRRCITDQKNVHFPSVANPPPLDIFSTFRIEILSPESQIPAEEVRQAALAVPLRSVLMPASRLRSLDDLRKAVGKIQEESARQADLTANNLSIVLRLTPTAPRLRRWAILLTGDAEEESWTSMKDRGCNLSARILKVSHHGSANGTPPWVVEHIRPRYSVISVGQQRHGHPTKEAYKTLLRRGNEIFCTEKNEKLPASACKGIRCPKSGHPGSFSILLQPRIPYVSAEPANEFCTEIIRKNFGS